MIDISEIPSLPDRDERFEEILVDCYGQYEELAAMNVYFEDAVSYPFAAVWKDPDEYRHQEAVTVLGVADMDDRSSILLKVKRSGGKEQQIVAEQIWAKATDSANAVVLDDYRYWVNERYGLTSGF